MDARHKLGILLTAILALPAEARFDHGDAAQIDAEEANNTETWNDKNSYRYPVTWEHEWQASEMAYRVNAGSLNVSRFNFADDIKFAPNPLERLTAAFTQSRREDLVEKTIDRELRIGWAFIPGMRLSLLGDADTLKEYGDLGLALTLSESPGRRTEVYAWGVDYYYASKRSDDAATRTKESKTYGMRSDHQRRGDLIGWQAKVEWDTPVDWTLPSAGWRYQYDRRLFDGRIELAPDPSNALYASALWERKTEGKTALTTVDAPATYKSMIRDSLVTELGSEYHDSSHIQYTAAVQRVWRRVHYDMSAAFSGVSIPGETRSPASVLRQEWGLILTRYATIDDDWSLQHGMMANDVSIQEDHRSWKTVELKYQLLFDFHLNDRTRFALNTTWDIDQIVRDYPYSKKSPFRPWGGGDLQFMMKI